MARLMIHERKEPYAFSKGTELPVYICGCGLSKSKPFCDGSHKKISDEKPSETYIYDDSDRPIVLSKRY